MFASHYMLICLFLNQNQPGPSLHTASLPDACCSISSHCLSNILSTYLLPRSSLFLLYLETEKHVILCDHWRINHAHAHHKDRWKRIRLFMLPDHRHSSCYYSWWRCNGRSDSINWSFFIMAELFQIRAVGSAEPLTALELFGHWSFLLAVNDMKTSMIERSMSHFFRSEINAF